MILYFGVVVFLLSNVLLFESENILPIIKIKEARSSKLLRSLQWKSVARVGFSLAIDYAAVNQVEIGIMNN